MKVTPSGMVIEVREVALNAPFPMLVTLAGSVIEVSPPAFMNAPAPMPVTPSGITTAPTQLPPSVTTPSVIL